MSWKLWEAAASDVPWKAPLLWAVGGTGLFAGIAMNAYATQQKNKKQIEMQAREKEEKELMQIARFDMKVIVLDPWDPNTFDEDVIGWLSIDPKEIVNEIYDLRDENIVNKIREHFAPLLMIETFSRNGKTCMQIPLNQTQSLDFMQRQSQYCEGGVAFYPMLSNDNILTMHIPILIHNSRLREMTAKNVRPQYEYEGHDRLVSRLYYDKHDHIVRDNQPYNVAVIRIYVKYSSINCAFYHIFGSQLAIDQYESAKNKLITLNSQYYDSVHKMHERVSEALDKASEFIETHHDDEDKNKIHYAYNDLSEHYQALLTFYDKIDSLKTAVETLNLSMALSTISEYAILIEDKVNKYNAMQTKYDDMLKEMSLKNIHMLPEIKDSKPAKDKSIIPKNDTGKPASSKGIAPKGDDSKPASSKGIAPKGDDSKPASSKGIVPKGDDSTPAKNKDMPKSDELQAMSMEEELLSKIDNEHDDCKTFYKKYQKTQKALAENIDRSNKLPQVKNKYGQELNEIEKQMKQKDAQMTDTMREINKIKEDAKKNNENEQILRESLETLKEKKNVLQTNISDFDRFVSENMRKCDEFRNAVKTGPQYLQAITLIPKTPQQQEKMLKGIADIDNRRTELLRQTATAKGSEQNEETINEKTAPVGLDVDAVTKKFAQSPEEIERKKEADRKAAENGEHAHENEWSEDEK